MTTLPMLAAVRPAAPGIAGDARSVQYAFDETCSVLVGWQRRDGVLRMLSPTGAVVGGVSGLRPGDSLRLVLYRDEVIVRDCRVTRATLQGVELTHVTPGAAPPPSLQ
jgi:hypothetical protein